MNNTHKESEFSPARTALFFAKGGVVLSPHLAYQISDLLREIAGEKRKTSHDSNPHPTEEQDERD